jgi:hypothetical protein
MPPSHVSVSSLLGSCSQIQDWIKLAMWMELRPVWKHTMLYDLPSLSFHIFVSQRGRVG